MFSNVYGYEGVRKAIRLMKNEIEQDGWNLGIGSLSDLKPSLVSSRKNMEKRLVLIGSVEPQHARAECQYLGGVAGGFWTK